MGGKQEYVNVYSVCVCVGGVTAWILQSSYLQRAWGSEIAE